MFEFKKLCDAYEKLTPAERGVLLTEKSVKILARLSSLDFLDVDPVETLAGFIVGSVVADGKIDEREYLLIYPALIKIFGYDFGLHSVKESFKDVLGAKKKIAEYTEEMLRILDLEDEALKKDVVMLCLCAVSLDGKISWKEKKYIRRLYRA